MRRARLVARLAGLSLLLACASRAGEIAPERNLDANFDRLAALPPARLTMPSYHIAGDRDPVLRMSARAAERMAAELPGFRGQSLLPGVGHWTQQEAPEAFDAALMAFLSSLD